MYIYFPKACSDSVFMDTIYYQASRNFNVTMEGQEHRKLGESRGASFKFDF